MTQLLAIHLLGPIKIELDGRPLTDLGTRKATALLAFLVCQTRPFSRETLAELLWDDRDPQQAQANLRSLLSGMRTRLKPYLTITRHTVAFNHESEYWLDTAEFLRLLQHEEAKPGPPGMLSAAGLQALETAVALYRGDFLDGFYVRESRGFEEWVALERERLQRQAIIALRLLVDRSQAQGEYAAALDYINQLIGLDDLSERANRDKMLLLARNGRLNAALRHYETYKTLLAAELDVLPGQETITLYEQILAARSLPPPNLPPQATPFVGRTRELADARRRLGQPTCRLLTLLGPGGMGKTRLALAVAGEIAAKGGLFLHGVRYVPLAEIHGPALLPTAVANACNLTFQGPSDPMAQLCDFLRPREMLLVLDNFEHLFGPHLGPLDGVDMLLTLLQEAPQLKLLVTSRARLQLQEEWVFDLGGLHFPESLAGENWESYSAICLFRQQAERVNHHFAPDERDYQAMAQVCRMLDGQPLGIELAAAWARQFTCLEIAQQIQGDLDFLSTNLRNVPARHRSLTAVFDHSWQLLLPAEQDVFARLAVFQGSFSREAAETVTQAGYKEIEALTAKSLLHRRADGRYDMHELLRQYAAQQLSRTAEEIPTAGRHARYYLDLLAVQGSGDETDQRQTILTDLPNIRAAWDWAARQRDCAELIQAARPLHGFYSVQSWFQEGIEAFQFALDLLATLPPTKDSAHGFCDLLSRKARLHIHIGQLAQARQALDTAMTYLPQVDDAERHSAILGYVAITRFYAGDFQQAAELAQESLRLAQTANDDDGTAFAYNFLGSCYKAMGDYEQAGIHFRQSSQVYQKLNDKLGEAMTLNNLGNLAQATGDFATAQAHYLTCSALFKTINHTHGAATTLANAGRLALKQGDTTQARHLLLESLALKREQKDDRGTAVALVGLGGVSVTVGDIARAADELYEALTLSQRSGDTKLMLEALNVMAALAVRRGQAEIGQQLLAFILNHKATAQEVRDAAQDVLAEVTAVLPADAQQEAVAAGKRLDLATAVTLAMGEKRP